MDPQFTPEPDKRQMSELSHITTPLKTHSYRCGEELGVRVCGRVGLTPNTARPGRAHFLAPHEGFTSLRCPHVSPLILMRLPLRRF